MESTVISFTYTKDDGSVSNRQLLVLTKPHDSYFGVELKDVDLTEIKPYLDYLAERDKMDKELQEKYKIKELKLPYKRFKVEKISTLTEEKLAIS